MKSLKPEARAYAGVGRSKGRTMRTAAAVFVFTACAAVLRAAPPVTGSSFSVVSRDPYASRIGYQVLDAGGTAADAAFAVAAALSVTEGHYSHVMGGGLWVLYYEKATGTVYAVDGVGPSGTHAGPGVFLNPKSGNPAYGMHLANVPGAWDGWMLLLKRFGSRDLPELLRPSIRLSETGFDAGRSLVSLIRQNERNIRLMPDTRRVFLPDGEVPAVGRVMKMPDLARTFRGASDAFLGKAGAGRGAAFDAARDFFYRGPVAGKIVEFSKRNGGTLEYDDLASFSASIVPPISTTYRDYTVYQCPPNSSGIMMLLALNILEGFDFSGYGRYSPEAIHLIAEATKLAAADRHFYVADPSTYRTPVELLLSKDYAERQRSRIRPDSALAWPIEGGIPGTPSFDTTTFQVVDRYGNAASVTASTGSQFLVVGDTGILINQRLLNYSLDPDNPNYLAPKKKVRHTANPYMAFRNGRLSILGTNSGYDTQPQGQIQQFLNVVEFGMDPQAAVTAPRFVTHAFPSTTYPHVALNTLVLEWGFPDSVRKALASRGHRLGEAAVFGNANMTVINNATGLISLGADPRGGNLALAR